jgi:hypothetical protein
LRVLALARLLLREEKHEPFPRIAPPQSPMVFVGLCGLAT